MDNSNPENPTLTIGPVQDQPEYYNPRQLAIKFGMSLKWVVKHTQEGRIPGQIKIGRLWRYRRSEVEKRLYKGQFLLEKNPTRNGNRRYV